MTGVVRRPSPQTAQPSTGPPAHDATERRLRFPCVAALTYARRRLNTARLPQWPMICSTAFLKRSANARTHHVLPTKKASDCSARWRPLMRSAVLAARLTPGVRSAVPARPLANGGVRHQAPIAMQSLRSFATGRARPRRSSHRPPGSRARPSRARLRDSRPAGRSNVHHCRAAASGFECHAITPMTCSALVPARRRRPRATPRGVSPAQLPRGVRGCPARCQHVAPIRAVH